MLTHEQLRARALENPGVAAAYDALEEEYALLAELLAARVRAGLTQAEVAERMNTQAPAVARIESSSPKRPPSLAALRKYAQAVGCKLEIKLVAKES